ncbi:MAG: leucyl aminopeptidase, partial [Nitrospinaceae bacterium]|nr:leucyl aminopeptidase [Nitrospinaceae bacterium]
RVKTGESVLVITDYNTTAIAERVAQAAASLGGNVVTTVMPPRKLHGEEPPSTIAAAMREADLIFIPVSISITHTRAVKDALASRARILAMSDWSDEMFLSPALLETDFQAQAEVCRGLGRAFTEGVNFHLTSPRGTDLRFEAGGRKANVMTNIPDPGEISPVPTIEVNVPPIEGSAEGTLVVDASIPYLGIGSLKEPFTCTIEKGLIKEISGGDESVKILQDAIAAHNDPNCWNIAELGVGLNPGASMTGRMLEDEGVLNTIHIGIGTSLMLGGTLKAATHYDLIMWDPVIEIDGKVVQRGLDILV